MAVSAVVPLDETEVKNPGSWPEVTEPDATGVSVGFEFSVVRDQVFTVFPPLLTTRAPELPSK
jgi:hypothetical protein